MEGASASRMGRGIGTVRLVGIRGIEAFPTTQIQRVRLRNRADGYSAQSAAQAFANSQVQLGSAWFSLVQLEIRASLRRAGCGNRVCLADEAD
jgi:hypothetical protein